MRQVAWFKHIGRVAFIGCSVGFINGTMSNFPEASNRIGIVAIISAIAGVFILQTVKYLKATFNKGVM